VRRFSLLILPLVAVLALALSPARAAIDLSKLSLNGVTPGDSAAHVQQVLGKTPLVKGKFLVYSKPKLTVELKSASDPKVVFVRDGSTLSQGKSVLLEAGDPVSKIAAALPGVKPKVREKPDTTEYYFHQGKRMLVVVVANQKVSGFVLGAAKW
jgi:hypothetical protein